MFMKDFIESPIVLDDVNDLYIWAKGKIFPAHLQSFNYLILQKMEIN